MHCLTLCLYRKCYGDNVREVYSKHLLSNPSRGTFLRAPHGKGHKCDTNELKKILTIISTALTIEHNIKHRRTPSKLEVGPGAREE